MKFPPPIFLLSCCFLQFETRVVTMFKVLVKKRRLQAFNFCVRHSSSLDSFVIIYFTVKIYGLNVIHASEIRGMARLRSVTPPFFWLLAGTVNETKTKCKVRSALFFSSR
ncbi:hypothetical protein AMECASPLE_008992 [Ameca splendens]|uniref:Secreted protein n=1 Tax=Ameca splendens TaxID=208324 RepID=A0ABV0Z8X4_9TELE